MTSLSRPDLLKAKYRLVGNAPMAVAAGKNQSASR